MENLDTILEVMETSCHVQKYLVNSEIALNDGDISATQTANEKAKQLIEVLLKDSFLELKEAYSLNNKEVDDYDLPSTLELLKQIGLINQSLAEIIGLSENPDDKLFEISKQRLNKAINTFEEIATSLYFN